MNTKGPYALSVLLEISRFVDSGGYVARYIRGSSLLHTSMRMGRCRIRRIQIRAVRWAVSARFACLGLSRWRESCLPLLLDDGFYPQRCCVLECPLATLGH